MTDVQTNDHTAGIYRSYLVRFWQSNERSRWHASAQCVQTGSTVLFGDVVGLLTFLQTEITDSRHQEKIGTPLCHPTQR